MTKLNNSNCEKTKQNILFLQNSKTQSVTKQKKLNYRKKEKIFTTVIILKNSNFDKTQSVKFWQNSKTQTMTKPKISKCDQNQVGTKPNNSNCDKTQQFKLGQN